MIRIFDVALAHFVIEDGRAVAMKGVVRLGKINEEALKAILLAFKNLDPVQEFEAEPEVVIATRLDKWSVRNDLHRLILYDLHKLHLPGMICTVEELLSEVNESAAAERRAHSQAASFVESETATERPSGPYDEGAALEAQAEGGGRASLRLLGLLASAILLSCTAVAFYDPAQGSGREDPGTVVDHASEREALRNQVVGVYMTGSRAGQHGIVVQQDGSMKIFQLNGAAPPSFINDVYQICRKEGRISLSTHQPGGAVRVLDKDTLLYCSEQYKRVP